MSLKIRLARTGSKKNPHYKFVVIESQFARDSAKFVEIIGHYHPKLKNDDRIVLNVESLSKWISNGANPSETVVKLALKKDIECVKKFQKQYIAKPRKTKEEKEIEKNKK